MRVPQTSIRYREIVVRIRPARVRETTRGGYRSGPPAQTYDAFIYTDLSLPWLSLPADMVRDPSMTLAGLPLAGRGQVRVRWSHYQEYLNAFFEGDKAAYAMRSRLFETLSSELEMLLSGSGLPSEPVRVWWSSETPELDDLPWELVVYQDLNRPPATFAFVRGLPADLAPIVPLDGPLRLALLHAAADPPTSLLPLLTNPPPDLTMTPLTGGLREGLQRAAREGFEVIHLICDGQVSLANEGLLRLGTDEPALASEELSALLRGSRVSLLSLSAPVAPTLYARDFTSSPIPQVYRAFAYLGSSVVSPPSLMAQLGPLQAGRDTQFWSEFYRGLTETLSLEDALARGQRSGPAIPMTLFLRHRLGREFRRGGTTRIFTDPSIPQPTQLASDLQSSRELLEQLKAIDARYGGLQDNVTATDLYEKESQRQTGLEEQLKGWTELAEDEK